MTSRPTAPPLLIVALLFASSAWGQFYEGFKALPEAFPYWTYDEDANSNGLGHASVQAAIDAATATLSEPTCAWPTFESQGGTQGNGSIVDPFDFTDPFNVVALWVTDSGSDEYQQFFQGIAASSVAVPLSYSGALYSCDIYLNAVDFAWSTDDEVQLAAVDLESRMLHELGHCLGLTHDPYESSANVWSGGLWVGEHRRALSERDRAQLCARYPTGGYAAPCEVQGDCASGLTCITVEGDSFCSVGCDLQASNSCAIPLVCAASAEFDPEDDGACVPPGSTGAGITRVGLPCADATGCGGPVGVSECLPEDTLPSGWPTWQDNYCSQDGCENPAEPCPDGSVCVEDVAAGGVTKTRCLARCGDGIGACREGYACAQLEAVGGESPVEGVCISACHTDSDCPGAATCRTCDGVCLPPQKGTARLGDVCEASTDCGAGQECIVFPYASEGVCTQRCDDPCGACPSDSTCLEIGAEGEQYCMRDCVEGSCQDGQQCGFPSGGRGCMPSCSQDTHCPTGFRCDGFGQCVDPLAVEEPECTLCFEGSGGIVGSPTEGGGPTAPTPAGCGCSGTTQGGTPLTLIGMLLLVVRAIRRRRVGRLLPARSADS